MPNYTGGVWRTIRGTHVFIRDGEDLETALSRVRKKGYTDNDFRKQEDRIAQLNKEYNALLDEEIDLQKDWNQWEEPGYELESAAYDRSQKEEELSEARKKYGEMSKSPYVERKLKLGRENYDKLMGKTNDKEIEDSIKSLYIYQDEKNMGSLRENPLGKYYDKYGKKNVDRVWKKMDDKYAIIKGTSMDSEGLRYNELVEKDKHSPEAIQYLQNRTEQAYKNYYGDSRKYNEEIAQAKTEFKNFKSHDSQIAETAYKQSVGDKKEFLRKMRQDYGWDNEDAKEQYNRIDKEWTDLAHKMEKDYDEFGTTNWKDEKRLNELSFERDRLIANNEPKYSSVVDRYNRDADFRNMLKQEHEKTIEATKKEISSYLDMPEKERLDNFGDKDELHKYISENYYAIDKQDFDRLYNEEVKRRNNDATEKLVFEREHLLNEKIGSTEGRNNLEDKAQATIERFKERKGKTQDTYTKTGNIRYSAFGIERTPEGDFSDDGTRFTAYRLPNGMEMTVAKANDEIYMSVRHPYNKEIKYEEYSKLPHYNDLDMYNGVYKNGVDLNKLIDSSNKFKSEYDELLKSKGLKPELRSNKEIRLENIRKQIEFNERRINDYNNSTDYSRWRYNRQQANSLYKKNERLKRELEKLL